MGPFPAVLFPFFATRNPGAGQDFTAWLRRFNSAFAFAWVVNFDSEVPALNRRELGANPRRPTSLRPPGFGSARQQPSPALKARADPVTPKPVATKADVRRRIGSFATRASALRFIFASVVKLLSSSASNGEFAGGSPAGSTSALPGRPIAAKNEHLERFKRYPKAAIRDFDGDPNRITDMDALIAYLQVLGTEVDFSKYQADAPDNKR